MDNFERKLMKFWIQSFLLGVPKIVVGFRSREGMLLRVEEIDTEGIPAKVKQRGRAQWDGDLCINFTGAFLECEFVFYCLILFWSICGFGVADWDSRAAEYHRRRRGLENTARTRTALCGGL